jgi:hypothetical protein
VPSPSRRFTIAAVVGLALVLPAYLWVACDLWNGGFVLDRYLPYEANFYDLQGRALLHGHLYLANGAIGIEAFVHAGHQYTYFGLFPSIIRIPVLLVTSRLDAHLTVPSMLLAWLVTAVCTSLLVWRVRCVLRADAPLGRAEAVSLGAFVAATCGGSVLVYLVATPFVFDEDLAWSVALTIASLFMLLGLLERPTGRRVWWCGLLILAANLDRVTTGWGCVVAAFLVAGYFWTGRAGDTARRYAVPLVVAGAVPLVIGALVNWLKFGQLFGLPMQDQVFSQINAYRQRFLAANGGEVGLDFFPSTLLAYLRPDALRITSAFPFVTLPAAPAATLGGVLFDRTYPTSSVTASMPLLFLASCWGTFACFRRRVATPAARRLAIVLVGAAVPAGAIFLWGYIADRYLADFLPLLAVAGAVGVVECWRVLEGRGRRARRWWVGGLVALAFAEVVVNVAASATPTEDWNGTQLANYVGFQTTVGSAVGSTAAERLAQGAQLPSWAPAGSLYVVGDCAGLYISNGERYDTVPLQVYQHATWMAADEGAPFRHVLQLTFGPGEPGGAESPDVPLLTSGPSAIEVEAGPAPGGALSVNFVLSDPQYGVTSAPVIVEPGSTHEVTLLTDPQLHQAVLTMDGTTFLDSVFTGGPDIAVAPGSPVVATVRDVTDVASEDALCRRADPGSQQDRAGPSG